MTERRKIKTPQEYQAFQARLSLAPISLPTSLNDYFSDVIPHMGNVLSFMRKYIGQDEVVKKVLDTYDSLPPFRRKDIKRVDLDYLAEKAGVEKIILRERILVGISRYGESKFKLVIAIYGEDIIKEMVAIALDSNHPDSQRNKEILAEYLGIKAIPKSASININTTNQSINVDQSNSLNLNNELPSMSETLRPLETLLKAESERRLIEGKSDFIDIDEFSQIDKEISKVASEDYIDEEDLIEDELELTMQGED